jgi:hypothetical protein
MFSKINIFKIIHDHIKTLRIHSTEGVSSSDFILFLFIPAAIGLGLTLSGVYLTDALINVLLACYSILTGLLINILVLIVTLMKSERVSEGDEPAVISNKKLKNQLLQETFSNVAFCVIMGIALSVLAIVAMKDIWYIRTPASFLVFSGSVNFVLTLLMILKRIYALLEHEVTPCVDEE